MSEYQYYEFVTIDRPLSRSDMDALREVSSRAEITSTCFSNVYNYGGFRGEPLDILTRYFDAMVYETNWGTRRLMLKLPRPAVDPKDLAPYCIEDGVAVHVSKYHVVLEMSVQEEGGDWIDEADSAQWMPSLVPLRAEILRGRRSAPYLAWLAAASHSVFEDEADNVTEPPVPPGLGDKSPALDSLADFLGLDRDLRTAAAERSEPAPDDTVTRAQLVEWLATVPTRDLHAWLARVALDGDAAVGHEVLQHHRAATRVAAPARVRAAGRTLRELFDVADTHRAQRKRSAAQATRAPGRGGGEGQRGGAAETSRGDGKGSGDGVAHGRVAGRRIESAELRRRDVGARRSAGARAARRCGGRVHAAGDRVPRAVHRPRGTRPAVTGRWVRRAVTHWIARVRRVDPRFSAAATPHVRVTRPARQGLRCR